MKVWAFFLSLALFIVLLAQDVYSSGYDCRDAVAPATKPRGVNLINRSSTIPIFKLHLKPLEAETGKKNNPEAYKVSVSIEKGFPLSFNEVTLSLSVNGSCGSGEFEFLPGDYDDIVQDQGDQCPRLLHTRQLQSKTQLPPLVWTPPVCGCVRIRILILESGQVYYAENEGSSKGPLVKTICFRDPQSKPTQVSRKQRLESLCHVIDKHSSSEIISRSQFSRHRPLDHRYMDYLGLEMAMELRRSDAMTCCSMIFDVDKMKCFEAARKRRIDGFCDDGIPDIPFRHFRQRHMKKLEKTCCFILGEERYKCFTSNSEIGKKIDGRSMFDYSMDASDVVNDLADFGSHELLDERLRPVGQEYDDGDDDDTDDDDDDDDGTDDDDDDDEDASDEEEEDDEDSAESVVSNESNQNKRRLDLNQVSEEIFVESDKDIEDVQDAKAIVPEAFTTQTSPIFPTSRYQQMNKAALKESSRREKNLSREAMRRKRKRKNRASNEVRRSSGEKKRKSRGGSRSKSSAERRNRNNRGGRRPMRREDLESGYEDQQGSSSADRTLKKLNRKMKRLKLQRMCCRAGGEIGTDVYGGLSQVKNECKHGSQKFIRSIKLGSKSRKCVSHFFRCCTEKAKKGLTMTSQEFVDNSLLTNWGNNQQYDAKLFDKVLSQRGRNPRPANNRRTTNIQIKKEDMGRPDDFTKTQFVAIDNDLTAKKEKKEDVSISSVQEQAIQNNTRNSIEDQNRKEKPQSKTRYTRKRTKTSRKQRRPYRKLNLQPVGALDSREMAEMNTKTYKDALDSREMADQYTKKKRKSNRWYKALRNHRRRSSAIRRRSRFG